MRCISPTALLMIDSPQNEAYRLRTGRLRLEPVTAADLPVLHAMLTDPVVRRYLCDDQVIPLTQTVEILETALESFAKHRYGLWLVYPEEQPEPVGIAGLYTFFAEPQPQLLYALLPRYQGQGFATEAARRIIRYAFAQLGYPYLVASCDPPNVASVRLMERLGMEWLKEERVEDKPIVFYHLTRAAYLEQHPGEPLN